MKYVSLPRSINSVAIAVIGLALTSGATLADTTKTIKGTFHASDGKKGSYVETVATDGDAVTVTFVYKDKATKETSTEVTTTTKVSDDSYTVAYSHTDFGTTAAFTYNKTIDKVAGGFTGKGTYTNADGTKGTVTSIDSGAGEVDVVSSTYAPASGDVGAHDLVVEEDGVSSVTIRTITVDPSGAVKSALVTRVPKD